VLGLLDRRRCRGRRTQWAGERPRRAVGAAVEAVDAGARGGAAAGAEVRRGDAAASGWPAAAATSGGRAGAGQDANKRPMTGLFNKYRGLFANIRIVIIDRDPN
jgi:hypothetical protein